MVETSQSRWRVSDREILDAVAEAVEDGATDLLAGGVPPVEVSERVGIAESTAGNRLQDLSETPELVVVWGARPSPPYRARRSYLPARTAETIAKTTQFNRIDKTL